MNDSLSPSWLNGNYIIDGYQVTIKSNLSIARFYCLVTEEDYYFQGNDADRIIDEIAGIWNAYDFTQTQAIQKWINMYL